MSDVRQSNSNEVQFAAIASDLLLSATKASAVARGEGNDLLKTVSAGINQHFRAAATLHVSALIPLVAAAQQMLSRYGSAVRVLQRAMLEVAAAERKWNGDASVAAAASASSACDEQDSSASVSVDPMSLIARSEGFAKALLAAASNYLFAVSLCYNAKATIALRVRGGSVATTAKPSSLLSLVLCRALSPAVAAYEASECPFTVSDEAEADTKAGAEGHQYHQYDDDDGEERGSASSPHRTCYFATFSARCVVRAATSSGAELVIHNEEVNSNGQEGSTSTVASPSRIPSETAYARKAIREAQRVLDLWGAVRKQHKHSNSNSSGNSSAEDVLADKLLLRLCRLLGPSAGVGDSQAARAAYRRLLCIGAPRAGGCALDAAAKAEATAEFAALDRSYY